MITQYFKNLNYYNSSFMGFYVLHYLRDEYYVCAYNDRNKSKNEIISLLTKLPSYRNLTAGDFDFHHVVEDQHLADISLNSRLFYDYGNMPTIMIHKEEHKRYNAILHTKETRFLYLRDQEKFTRQNLSADKRRKIARNILNNNNHSAIIARIKILGEIYESVYEGNKILQIIAKNIFHEYQQSLR